MTKKPEKIFRQKSAWALAIALSAGFHLALLASWPLWQVKVDQRSAALSLWLKPQKEAALKTKSKTVLSLAEPAKEVRPKDARYLANHDHTVEQERVLRSKGQQASKRGSRAQAPSAAAQSAPLPSVGLKKLPRLKENPHDPLGIWPTADDAQVDLTGADDLKDVKEGDQSKLNAWQWEHAPFFNRIKEKIAQIWSPQQQINRYDPEGSLLGQQDLVTVMAVSIDRRGGLTKLNVAKSSGVAYLDQEAERAFQEAAPFLYPPAELFLEAQEFSFTFSFHLYLNRRFSLDFDWER